MLVGKNLSYPVSWEIEEAFARHRDVLVFHNVCIYIMLLPKVCLVVRAEE